MTQPRVANASDPGCAKTGSACVYTWYMWETLKGRSVWVQPKSITIKNLNELLAFTPFEPADIAVVDGTPKQKEKALTSGAKVFIMTAHGLKTYGPRLKELYPDIKLLVVDEFHMVFGGHTSQRTQAFYRFMRTTPYLVAMSGTLLNGKPDTVFPLVQVIEPRYYGTYDAFKSQHHWTDDYGNVLGYRNLEKIAEIFRRHSVRRTFQETYGPEAKVIEVEVVEMGTKQRVAYDEFHKEGLLELEQCFMDGSLPGVKAIRCRQLAAHPEMVMGEVISAEQTGKDERLLLHAEDHLRAGTPFVVFAALIPEQRRIRDLLVKVGLRVGYIAGEVSGPERERISERFQAGELDVIVASPGTGSVGFNWGTSGGKEVSHVIYVSMDYVDTNFLQSYRRMMRGVRKSALRITVLAYEDSIDLRIFEIVRKKSELANEVDNTRQVFDLSPYLNYETMGTKNDVGSNHQSIRG